MWAVLGHKNENELGLPVRVKSPWCRHGVSREINVDVAVIMLIMSMFCRFYLSAAGTPHACHLEELVKNSEGPAVVAYDL